MSAAIFSSPEDVLNDSLARIGYKRRINNIYDGTEAAKVALDIYSQTRDQLLRDGDWGFARGDVSLTAIKTAPAGGYVATAWSDIYPPLPWNYSYTYPDDCLKVRSLRLTPLFLPNFDPQPIVFSTPNDTESGDKVITAMIGPLVVCTYARQVADVTQWEASFTEALCAALARRLAPALAGMDAAKMEAGDEQVEVVTADVMQG